MPNKFIMKAQEVKPAGRRLIGCFHIRAAHNVHKVDVIEKPAGMRRRRADKHKT